MDPVQMGRFLARLRKEAGLTQEALGQTLGVTNKTVSRWENGNYLPDLEMLQLLGARFGVSVDELICGARRPVRTAQDAPAQAMMGQAASEQAASGQTASKQADRMQPGSGRITQAGRAAPDGAMADSAVSDGVMPRETAFSQADAVQAEAKQTVPPQADAAGTAASPFVLRERIAYWKRKWLREHAPALLLCYLLLCIVLPVAAGALELSGNTPFLLGAWSLLTLVFYITARNRMMIYVEARAFLP